MARVVFDPGQLRRAWSRFLDEGKVPQQLLPPVIARSWTRCLSLGVPVNSIPDYMPLAGAEMRLAQDKYHELLVQARPVMEHLHQLIDSTHSVVLLSDASGLILHAVGDADFMSRAEQVALRPGVSWSETHIGTNAIGTAIVEQTPTVVYCAEHYVERNNFLTCSATPIFDSRGQLLGVLDISGDYRAHQDHTIGLVRMAAQIIESAMFSRSGAGEFVLHFHPHPEYLGSLMEGQAVFDHQGQLLAANQCARQMMGLAGGDIAGTFADYFEQSLGLVMGQARPDVMSEVALRLHGGARVCARLEERAPRCSDLAPGGGSPFHRDSNCAACAAQESQPRRRSRGRHHPPSATGAGEGHLHPHRGRVRHRQGDAGARHPRHGPRAGRPFVAVNCAAIPEGLIESELFGYAEGAFTSAKRKGHVGKIQMADGGTLLLDEIGDMPLPLQASLLRVLQERLVTPLGSVRAIPVNIAVICATHRGPAKAGDRGPLPPAISTTVSTGSRWRCPRCANAPTFRRWRKSCSRRKTADGRFPSIRRSWTSSSPSVAGEHPPASQRGAHRGRARGRRPAHHPRYAPP